MADPVTGNVLMEVRDSIAFITVNRPDARNAMTSAMFEEMMLLLDRVQSDRDIRVVLMQGAGTSFIAGGDVKAFAAGLELSAEDRAEDMKRRAARAGRISAAIARLPQPVIVAVRGYAVGAGLSIVAAADLVIASENAQFVLAHISLGMSPDGAASFFLPRVVGLKRANQIALLGDAVSAREACAMGLINWVVPDEELDTRARQLVMRLVAAPAAAVAQIKRLFQSSFERDLDEQVIAENESLRQCALTDDFAEGLRAIKEKRKPRFGGVGTS